MQRVKLFVFENVRVIFHANDYKINQPNFKNNLKTLKKHIEGIKAKLKEHNSVDLKHFHNIKQVGELFHDGALEVLSMSAIQDSTRYKFIFSYDIIFIDMLISTWISLFI